MRILVTYCPRSGHTRRVAESLARRLGAQVEPIGEIASPHRPRGFDGPPHAMRSGEAAIGPPSVEPADFDLVVLGTAVWASHPSAPARAFAARYGQRMRRAALFCTVGGSDAEPALHELARLVGHPPVATLTLTELELHTRAGSDKIDRFASALRAIGAPA